MTGRGRVAGGSDRSSVVARATAPDGADDPGPLRPYEVNVPTAAAMRHLGAAVAAFLRAGDLVLLSGPLGAGKTTFAQGVGLGLQVSGQVASPTFVLARVHPSLVGGPALVHVDAYRLASAAELDDLDLDADLDSAVTLVEWGAGIVESLSAHRLEVDIDRDAGSGPDDDLRVVRYRTVGTRWAGVGLPGGMKLDHPG